MDRRSFLTAMFGIAGAAAFASAVRPINAVAGIPGAKSGILDELDPEAEVEPVNHRRYYDQDYDPDYYYRRHRRHRRRRGWRRVCRSYWRHGRRRVRCYRRRVPSVVLRF
jgi:hypothetical protein